MGVYVEAIGDRSLGLSTAKTQLSGDRSGNAAAWILPASCRGILAIQPMAYEVTPTAAESLVASLKVESDDLGIQAYEVLAAPSQSNVATTDFGAMDSLRGQIYPAMFPTKGGEAVNFFGIPQTANTAAPFMGASAIWTDNPAQLNDLPYRALIGGTAGGAGSGTSTGTATGAVTGKTASIAGSQIRYMRSVSAVVASTTMASVKPISGWAQWSAPEFAAGIRASFEPVPGNLNATQVVQHLTRVDNLNVQVLAPSTVSMSIYLTSAPSTAGNFYQGFLYQ